MKMSNNSSNSFLKIESCFVTCIVFVMVDANQFIKLVLDAFCTTIDNIFQHK